MEAAATALPAAAAAGEPAPPPAFPSLKKTCDFCIRRKRHCDGFSEEKGLRRCSLCIAKKLPECHYSLRSPMPRKPSATNRPRRRRRNAAAGGLPPPPSTGLTFFREDGETAEKPRSNSPSSRLVAAVARRSAAETLLRLSTPSPTRIGFSASPATGLVGTKENVFLAEFFSCFGFWPLTTQSDVRGTMVSIMSSPRSLHRSSSVCGALVLPSTCSFWCTVAMGALVKGAPIESVAGYCQRARDILASYAGPGNAEVVKAGVMMAYLHGCMGDRESFHEYLVLSEGFLRDSAGRGCARALPMGFDEAIKYGDTVKFFNDDVAPDREESLLAEEVTLPQIGEAATEGDIFRFVYRSYRAIEQNAYVARAGHHGGTTGCENDGDAVPSEGAGNPHPPAPPRPLEVNLMKVKKINFEHLEPAVDRPSIRVGVGGLAINAALACEKVVKGDPDGALERLGRCVEVFERYPGLLRFTMGAHGAHSLLSIAAAVGKPLARELFDKLRRAYNLMAPLGSTTVPALEEWQGISAVCDKVSCGAMEFFFAKQEENE
eukprot:g2192.t2